MRASARPSLFIGSSVEGLDVAYALQECLEYDAEPTVWPQGVFNPTGGTLSALLDVARRTDFAVFVFTPDDIRTMRKSVGQTPRDNVVFELGLFIGAIGPSRCFFLMPADVSMQLPTDLIGLTPLTYVSSRSDGNLIAALGPTANRIRRALTSVGPLRQPELAVLETNSDPLAAAAEFIRLWNTGEVRAARETLRQPVPAHRVEDETGEASAAMRKAFVFLESMADGVLSNRLDEETARAEFSAPLHALWARAYTYLAPLNQADDWWRPLPRLAELDQKWNSQSA